MDSSPAGPVCSDASDPDTCVSFAYEWHLEEANLPSGDAACDRAIALSDSTSDGTTTYPTHQGWSAELVKNIRDCGSEEIFRRRVGANNLAANSYVIDNPISGYGDTSFAPWGAPDPDEEVCGPVNFIDLVQAI